MVWADGNQRILPCSEVLVIQLDPAIPGRLPLNVYTGFRAACLQNTCTLRVYSCYIFRDVAEDCNNRSLPNDPSRLTQDELNGIRQTALCLEGMLGELQTALANGAAVERGPYSVDQDVLGAVVAAGIPKSVVGPGEAAAAQVLPSLPNAVLMGRLLTGDSAGREGSPKMAKALRKHNRRLYLQMLAALQMHVELAFVKSPALRSRTDWSDLIGTQMEAKWRLLELRLAAWAHFLHWNPRSSRITQAVNSLTGLLKPRATTVIPIRPR